MGGVAKFFCVEGQAGPPAAGLEAPGAVEGADSRHPLRRVFRQRVRQKDCFALG
jgi:hypothetical protein